MKKQTTKTKTKWPAAAQAEPMMLKETAVLPGIGLAVPLRAAKSKFSALVEWVASGQRVTITSGGVPKAVLSPVEPGRERQRFTGMGDFLLQQPVHGGAPAEELVREDRDSRGW